MRKGVVLSLMVCLAVIAAAAAAIVVSINRASEAKSYAEAEAAQADAESAKARTAKAEAEAEAEKRRAAEATAKAKHDELEAKRLEKETAEAEAKTAAENSRAMADAAKKAASEAEAARATKEAEKAKADAARSEELKAKVKSAKNFRAATNCRRQLAFAKLDIQLHVDPGTDAVAVKEENFRHFGIKFEKCDRFLCAFTHIFAGGYAAGYYGYKWAEVMCADCYGAFEDVGLDDDAAVKRVGKRYRDTILALGGSKNALEVFRMFRGRDPEIGAMLRQQGLVEK